MTADEYLAQIELLTARALLHGVEPSAAAYRLIATATAMTCVHAGLSEESGQRMCEAAIEAMRRAAIGGLS